MACSLYIISNIILVHSTGNFVFGTYFNLNFVNICPLNLSTSFCFPIKKLTIQYVWNWHKLILQPCRWVWSKFLLTFLWLAVIYFISCEKNSSKTIWSKQICNVIIIIIIISMIEEHWSMLEETCSDYRCDYVFFDPCVSVIPIHFFFISFSIKIIWCRDVEKKRSNEEMKNESDEWW